MHIQCPSAYQKKDSYLYIALNNCIMYIKSMRLILPIFAMLLLVVSSCKEDNDQLSCSMDNLEADPSGNWYKGDMHVHASGASNDTDGVTTPELIKAKALAHHLDFIVLTDHSNSTGSDTDTTYEDPLLFNKGSEFPYWMTAAELTDPGSFIMVDGNEISPRTTEQSIYSPTGHIGCIPMNLESFDTSYVFVDRPMGTVTGGNALQQSIDAGCFSVINHPYSPLPYLRYDWTSMDYDALEIWNGTIGYDGGDESARITWICDLLAGKSTVPIAASDCHRSYITAPGSGFDPALGYPATYIFADELSWDKLVTGLQAGMVALGEGESFLRIDGYNDQGCRAEDSNMKHIRLRGKADIALLEGTKVLLTHTSSCSDNRPASQPGPSVIEDTLYIQALVSGNSFDYLVSLENLESGVYTARFGANNLAGNYLAFSRAIVIP